jgi:methylenetetrahydrofolate dehydrogenase (NADP+)/methenyltetrahydrofolate cyclohydrolase
MDAATEAKIIDGRALARSVLANVAEKVRRIIDATGVTPCLATVLVGDDPASVMYTRMKRKRCLEVGMTPRRIELPGDSSTEQVIDQVAALGGDASVHAILVQHPVPNPIDRRAVFETIPLAKDVDGVTSAMLGRVLLGMPSFIPCTPEGIMRMLDAYDVDLDGADAIVIGRSPILGRPMASMLINRHATVTLCHSRTRGLSTLIRRADVVIAALGRPRFIKGAWIKPGAVIIDAGYNEGNIGDVEFEAAIGRASLITPVPGGVGPMTIAVLMEHTADAAAAQIGVDP